MFTLIVIFYFICVVFGLAGFSLILGGLNLPARVRNKLGEAEGPVGLVLMVVAIGAAAYVLSYYTPSVEQKNKLLVAANDQLRGDLAEANGGRTKAQSDLLDEKSRSGELQAKLTGSEISKRQARSDLASTSQKLSRANAALTATQGKLAAETKRANGLAGKNEVLVKKLGESNEYVRAVLEVANRFGLSDRQKAEFDKFREGVLALNKDLTQLRIATTFWPRLEGRNAVATFEIYRKDFEADQSRPRGAGLFDFNSQQYKIRGDYNGRLAEELRNHIAGLICEAARRAIVEHVSLSDAVKAMPPIRNYDLNRILLETFAEFEYVQMRIKLMAGSALVLVRGYADGEQGPWKRKLDPADATIRLHELAKSNGIPPEYALTFRSDLTQVEVGEPSGNPTSYRNTDLPNLRGAEAAAIVAALVGACPAPGSASIDKVGVGVLGGRVYPDHSKIDRKARVHLLVFLKSS